MSSYTTFNENTGNTNTTANFTGLDNGKYYQFRISAINSEGSGVVAVSDKALLSGPPNAVTNLTPTIGADSVSLSWTKPSSSGGKLITGYKIESKLYAETVPDALASVSATAGNGECVISWVAPTDPADFGYSDITGYKVEYAADPYSSWDVKDASTTSNPYTVTGLTNGTNYKFRVSVINGEGNSERTSEPTESSIATPQAVPPDPPTSLTVSAGNQQFTGSWTAPSETGGAAITGYDLLYAPGPSYNSFTTVSIGNTTSYAVLSLTNGTSYKFKVSAENSAGIGAESALSPVVTPSAFSITSTGGIVTRYTSNSINYTVYEFRYNGGTSGTQTTYTFTVSGSKAAEVFIVGGGGSGGSDGGGGGGGGGVVYDPNITLGAGDYTVKVGNGGDINTHISNFGEKGSDSEITTDPTNAITTNLTLPLKGKGGGPGYTRHPPSGSELSADGGSGGGAHHVWQSNAPRPAGDSNQGNTYWNGSSWVAGGHSGGVAYKGGAGGGGAGGDAPDQTSNSSNTGSRGGHGVDNNWLGDDNGNNKGTGWRNYAAGGGGGHWQGDGGEGGQSASNPSNDTTGSGGGGKGANGQTQTSGYSYSSEHGREHRGGGGGGEGYEGRGHEGQGGSGIVLIRYVT